MNLLALETSTMLGGVAILKDDTLIAESRINVKVTHSERLMGEIDHLLGQSGMRADDIDVFGMAIGPGSFTGLRVGLSILKGLAYATGRPLVSVPTLEAFAWNLPFSAHQVCPLLDARKGEVYAGIFRWSEGAFLRVLTEQAIKIDDLLTVIEDRTVFFGEGALLHRERIEKVQGERALFAPPQKMVPSAANVAYLCMRKARGGELEDPVTLTPLYLRRSEAETKRGASCPEPPRLTEDR